MFELILVMSLAAFPILDDAPQPQLQSPMDVALVVGVSDYAFIEDVPYADRDARAFANYLIQARGVPPDRVRLLVDGKAVRETIQDGLRFVVQKSHPEGLVWIYFAGHGVPDPDTKDGLLAGADVQQSLASFSARSLSRRSLVEGLSLSRARQAVVLLDACFSGQTREGNTMLAGLRPLMAVPPAADISDVLVLSAAGESETSGPFDRVRQGLFSYFAIGGLRGWADLDGDTQVTADELLTYVRRGAGAVLADGTRSQTPAANVRENDPRLRWTLAVSAVERGPNLTKFHANHDVSVAVGGEGRALGEVPELSGKLKPTGALQFDVEPDVLVAYDAALIADESGKEDPARAAVAWEQVYELQNGNPFRADALARSRQWREFASRSMQLKSQREADENRVRRLLPLASLSPQRKEQIVTSFSEVYGGKAAAAFLRDVTDIAVRRTLCAKFRDSIPKKAVEVQMPFVNFAMQRGSVFVDGTEVGEAPGIVHAAECASTISVKDERGVLWDGNLNLDAAAKVVVQPAFSYVREESFDLAKQKELYEKERPWLWRPIIGWTLAFESLVFLAMGTYFAVTEASGSTVPGMRAAGPPMILNGVLTAGIGGWLLYSYYSFPAEPNPRPPPKPIVAKDLATKERPTKGRK